MTNSVQELCSSEGGGTKLGVGVTEEGPGVRGPGQKRAESVREGVQQGGKQDLQSGRNSGKREKKKKIHNVA